MAPDLTWIEVMNSFAIKVLSAELGKTHLFSAGQAGYIIKSASGQLLGIDLYLSDCVERLEGHIGFKRLLPKILMPEDLKFDVLVATHPHFDHFDVDAIPMMMAGGKTHIFASKNCRELVDKAGMTTSNVSFVSPGDECRYGDFNISFVSCDHGSGAPDAVGVVVSVDGLTIFETGDTCLRLDRLPEYRKFAPFDVLIAPINGAYGNLNEDDCARLSASLTPTYTVPCHYGMFASHGGDPGRFLAAMKVHCPRNQILLLSQGEKFTFQASEEI